jgi:hypothetical protein
MSHTWGRNSTVTIQKIYVKEFGKEAWEKLNPRLKKLFIKTDSLTLTDKPVSRKLLEKALN